MIMLRSIKIDFADGGVVVGQFAPAAAEMLLGTYTREQFDLGDRPAAAAPLDAEHGQMIDRSPFARLALEEAYARPGDTCAYTTVALYQPLYLCPLGFAFDHVDEQFATMSSLMQLHAWCETTLQAGSDAKPRRTHRVLALQVPDDDSWPIGYVTGTAVWRAPLGTPHIVGDTPWSVDQEVQRFLRGKSIDLRTKIHVMLGEDMPPLMCACPNGPDDESGDGSDGGTYWRHQLGRQQCQGEADSIYVIRP